MKKLMLMIGFTFAFMATATTYAANPCSVEVIRSMIEEGLTDDQIQSICNRAKLYQGSEDVEEDIYTKSQRFYANQQFDEIIELLGHHCQENPYDYKGNLLLAKAYLEKVEIMKANGNKEYRALVMKPYSISRRFLTNDPENAEALYIAGRSFVLNNRPSRGIKYIRKAIEVSKVGNCEYYIAFGDGLIEAGKTASHISDRAQSKQDGKKAYETAFQLAQIDWLKDKAQKKLDAIK